LETGLDSNDSSVKCPPSKYMTLNRSYGIFSPMIDRLTAANGALWRQLPAKELDLGRRFTSREQEENEKRFGPHLLDPNVFSLSSITISEFGRRESIDNAKKIIGEFGHLSYDTAWRGFFENSEVVTKRFVEKAKTFDPLIKDDDIHQALRNLWVFNSIQMILGHAIELTPSSFAYSLLYPYTDNGLDSPLHTRDEKRAYIRWLSDWLEKNNHLPVDGWTGKTAELLRMIENEFPRKEFSDVYMSLRAIHEAQAKSLILHDVRPDADEDALMAVTIEKGGTSVLADGFLAVGNLTVPEVDSLFEYGVVLQLIDDLRDLDEDRMNGHSNPFLRAADNEKLDGMTGQLLVFVNHCAMKLGAVCRTHSTEVQEMIERSCSLLILDATSRYHERYSGKFLRKAERWMPFRPAFLRDVHDSIRARQAIRNSAL